MGPPNLVGNDVEFVIDLLQCGLEAIGLEQQQMHSLECTSYRPGLEESRQSFLTELTSCLCEQQSADQVTRSGATSLHARKLCGTLIGSQAINMKMLCRRPAAAVQRDGVICIV